MAKQFLITKLGSLGNSPNTGRDVLVSFPGGLALQAKNNSGGAIAKGNILRWNGWDATRRVPCVAKADTSAKYGMPTCVAIENIANGGYGTVGILAEVDGLDTSAFAEIGSRVYTGTTPGTFSATDTQSENNSVVQVGHVTRKSATDGAIYFDFLTAYLASVGGDQLQVGLVRYIPSTVSYTIGAENNNTIVVTGRIQVAGGAWLDVPATCRVWLSDTAGGGPCSSAPSGAVSFTTGTALATITTKLVFDVITDSSGRFAISITHDGAKTLYVNCSYNGKISSSGAVTFAE